MDRHSRRIQLTTRNWKDFEQAPKNGWFVKLGRHSLRGSRGRWGERREKREGKVERGERRRRRRRERERDKEKKRGKGRERKRREREREIERGIGREKKRRERERVVVPIGGFYEWGKDLSEPSLGKRIYYVHKRTHASTRFELYVWSSCTHTHA